LIEILNATCYTKLVTVSAWTQGQTIGSEVEIAKENQR